MSFPRAALVLTLAAGLLPAQENSGRIFGTVTDPTGAAIPGASIVLTSPTLPGKLSATSDAAGAWALPRVPIGVQTVTVSKTGFATLRQVVEVTLGSRVEFNPRLTLAAVAETVEVSDALVSLETTSSRTSTSITRRQFENLPKSRSFTSLLAIAPGVRLESKAGGSIGLQVDGSSGSENAFLIDGVDVTDLRSGSLRGQNSIPLQFVQEVQIKSGGFEAEYGGSTGGVVNVATRSGTNQFHGSAELEASHHALSPGPRGNWQRSPLNANLAEFYKPLEDDSRTLFPGGSLGGPLVPNRVFFFGSYMPTLGRTLRTVNYPSGVRSFLTESTQSYGLARVDVSVSSRVQISSSWIWSPFKSSGRLPGTDPRIAPPSNDLSLTGGFQPAQAYSFSMHFTPDSRFQLSARYGYKYLNDKGSNYGLPSDPFITFSTPSTTVPGLPPEISRPGGYSNVSSTLSVVRDITDRHNIYVDGSWVGGGFAGQHHIKAGYASNLVGNDVLSDYTNGRFVIYWNESYSRGSITNQRGAYGYYIWQDGVRLNAAVRGRNHGFYLQDSWRPHARVSLNIGVRFENEFLPPYKKEVNSVKIANPVSFGWGEKIAPRLGVAWDLAGDGRWKLSGSFGLFYDVMKYELARGAFGGDYWWSHVYRLDNPDVFRLGRGTPGALGPSIISFDNRSIPINAQGELAGVERDMKPYATREFSLGLDRQLTSRLVAGVRYTRKDLLRVIEDIGVLNANDSEVYLIGNPGFGQTRDTRSVYGQKTPNGQEFLVPKAVREYNGVEFRLQGEITSRINLLASYTWSRLYGNYSGLANSDENGRSDPGVSRSFDLPYYYFDSSGSQRNVFGPLATDRPHAIKLFATWERPWKLGTSNFGLQQIAYSGAPESTTVTYQSAPTYPNGRGDLGRSPFRTQTDLAVTHEIRVRERARVRLSANISNLLNQATVTGYVAAIARSGAITAARLPVSRFFQPWNVNDFVNLQNRAGFPIYNPIYRYPNGYLGPRSMRLGISLMF